MQSARELWARALRGWQPGISGQGALRQPAPRMSARRCDTGDAQRSLARLHLASTTLHGVDKRAIAGGLASVRPWKSRI